LLYDGGVPDVHDDSRVVICCAHAVSAFSASPPGELPVKCRVDAPTLRANAALRFLTEC